MEIGSIPIWRLSLSLVLLICMTRGKTPWKNRQKNIILSKYLENWNKYITFAA